MGEHGWWLTRETCPERAPCGCFGGRARRERGAGEAGGVGEGGGRGFGGNRQRVRGGGLRTAYGFGGGGGGGGEVISPLKRTCRRRALPGVPGRFCGPRRGSTAGRERGEELQVTLGSRVLCPFLPRLPGRAGAHLPPVRVRAGYAIPRDGGAGCA